MQLPGRLRATTLGDVLGAVHRACASGTLEILEDRGRIHRVYVAEGLVAAVELDGAAPSLAELLRRDRLVDDETLRRSLLRAMASRRLHGEVLVTEFHLARSVVDAALRKQLLARLHLLEQVGDAQLLFRVALRSPRGALRERPLQPREFLVGRKRARDRVYDETARSAPAPTPRAPQVDAVPFRVLGVPAGADTLAIKRAYRKLALRLHPDMHPKATEAERRALSARFAEVTAAYKALVA